MQKIKGIGMICAVIATLMFHLISSPFSGGRNRQRVKFR